MVDENISILKAISGNPNWRPKLRKTFKRNVDQEIKKTDYDKPLEYTHHLCELTDLLDLSGLLMMLEGHDDVCVIRGELRPGVDPSRVVRRKDAHRDGRPPCFQERKAGRHWACFDFDKVPLPQLSDRSLEAKAEYLVKLLPEEFWNASYHLQWSSSYGVYGWDLPSAHLWFWLDQPRTDTELMHWCEDTQEYVDSATFRTVQPIYTSRPMFVGMSDPLGDMRSKLVRKDRDTVPLPAYQRPVKVRHFSGSSGRSCWHATSKSFEERLLDIGDDARGFHNPIRDAIAAYVGRHGYACDREYLKARIRERAWSALETKGRDLSHYLSDQMLDASIDGATQKFGQTGTVQQFKRNHYKNEEIKRWTKNLKK